MSISIKLVTTKSGYKTFNNSINEYLEYNYIVNNYSELTKVNKFALNNLDKKYENDKLLFIGINSIDENSYLDKALDYALKKLEDKQIPYKVEKVSRENKYCIIKVNDTKDNSLADVNMGFADDETTLFIKQYYNAKELRNEISEEMEV